MPQYLSSSFCCLHWLRRSTTAKLPETRPARVAETARLAVQNQRANRWKGKNAA